MKRYPKNELKYCPRCKQKKPLKDFYLHKTRGHQNRCKICSKDKTGRQLSYKRAGRARHFKKQYGISMEQYNALLKKQKHKCAICRGTYKLVVDHCHRTKKVRGILCDACNIGIGRLGDSVQLLRKALQYLKKNR